MKIIILSSIKFSIGLSCEVYDYPWKRQSPKIIKEENMNKFEKIFLKAFNYWLIFNVD